jgi:hypothetical protein
VARLAENRPFGRGLASWRNCSATCLLKSLLLLAFQSIDHGDEGDFTIEILSWWKRNASEVWAWSEAARIALAKAPNSAGAERIFSLLKKLFESNQDTALSDYIFEPTMHRCNNTKRANEGKLGR